VKIRNRGCSFETKSWASRSVSQFTNGGYEKFVLL